jgi:hypothetical protein
MESPVLDVEDLQCLIRSVLRGAKDGRMEEQSLRAAVSLSVDIETLQATLRMLQTGELFGRVDDTGEVVLSKH